MTKNIEQAAEKKLEFVEPEELAAYYEELDIIRKYNVKRETEPK